MSAQLHNQLVVGLMWMVAFRLVFVLTWLIISTPGWERSKIGDPCMGDAPFLERPLINSVTFVMNNRKSKDQTRAKENSISVKMVSEMMA